MKILVLCIFFTGLMNAQSYDNELLEFFCGEKVGFDALKKRAEQKIGRTIESKSPEYRIILGAARYPYALLYSGDDSTLGLFVVSDLRPEIHPFVSVFTDVDTSQGENAPLFGSLASEIEMLGCEVLELHDAKVTNGNLLSISSIKTIKHLGLPNRGMGFSEGVKFPINLETLIVRNSYLNDHFFKAINEHEYLQKLVIYDCGLSYDSPKEPNAVYSDETWVSSPEIFKDVSSQIVELKVIDSDPSIFNHLVGERWAKLQELSICLYPQNYKAMNYLAISGGEIFESKFPKLDVLSFKDYGIDYEKLRERILSGAASHEL